MDDEWVGRTFNGRYEILELLGTGGMSSVYKANDPNLDRVVAIKIIHPHLSVNEEFIRRFRTEARSVAQLRHPNIVQVFDFDSSDRVIRVRHHGTHLSRPVRARALEHVPELLGTGPHLLAGARRPSGTG